MLFTNVAAYLTLALSVSGLYIDPSFEFGSIELKRDSVELDTSFFRISANASKEEYFEANKNWATNLNKTESLVLETSAKGQKPHTLVITCSDSRVSLAAFGVYPGEIFEHKDIANVIVPTDINSQAVIQYAVENLKVKKIIVVGHTGCGGVNAALSSEPVGGVLDLWLNPVRSLRVSHFDDFKKIKSADDRAKHLSELNAVQSAQMVKTLPSVAKALQNKDLEVWAFLYDTATGLMSDLEVPETKHLAIYLLNGKDKKDDNKKDKEKDDKKDKKEKEKDGKKEKEDK